MELSEETKKHISEIFGVSYEELVTLSEDEREKLINSLKKETKKAKREVNKKHEYIRAVEKFLKAEEKEQKRIRQYTSYLSKEKADEYLQKSKSIEPCNKRLSNKSTDELIKEGSELMKKEGFKISDNENLKNL